MEIKANLSQSLVEVEAELSKSWGGAGPSSAQNGNGNLFYFIQDCCIKWRLWRLY